MVVEEFSVGNVCACACVCGAGSCYDEQEVGPLSGAVAERGQRLATERVAGRKT